MGEYVNTAEITKQFLRLNSNLISIFRFAYLSNEEQIRVYVLVHTRSMEEDAKERVFWEKISNQLT